MSTIHVDGKRPRNGSSCVLDVAALDGQTLDEVGAHIGCSRERVRQIEEAALKKLKRAGVKREHLEAWRDHVPRDEAENYAMATMRKVQT
jgi:hypothetical protein